jgi:WD40 repeat protein
MALEGEDSILRNQRLHAVLHAYLKAVDAGLTPDRQEILQLHPDLTEELTSYFSDPGKLEKLAQSLRTADRASPPPPNSISDAPTIITGQKAKEDASLATMRSFGDYELLEEIARGGMGVIYKARQISLNRTVAVKMILGGRLASTADVQRFRTEAEAAANLDHPHIVPIYEVGEQSGHHYFSMKLIEGGSLAQTKFDQRQAALVMAKVARAVHHAHQRGILHRDVKPSNILLDSDGEPHVTDFGVAKRFEGDSSQTRTGTIIGTPSYMAPEQAEAKKSLTTGTDVYSLGAILYELLTGQPPFRSETPLDTLLQVIGREPVRPRAVNAAIDPDLETICLKCLEKEPARRYDSAAALADDLERWLRGEPIEARPSTPWVRTVKWAKRKPAVAALVGVSGSAVVGLTILLGALLYNAEQRAAAVRRLQDAEINLHDLESRSQSELQKFKLAGDKLRQTIYATDLNQAQQALATGNGLRLISILQRPELEDVRSFEWHYLWRQGHGQRQTLHGHTQPVTRVVYSPDGRTIATAAASHSDRPSEVIVWDNATGQAMCTILCPSDQVTALAFSPDGKMLATGSASGHNHASHSRVQLWDASSGNELSELKGVTGHVHALAFAANGQLYVCEQFTPSFSRRDVRRVTEEDVRQGAVPSGIRLWRWDRERQQTEEVILKTKQWHIARTLTAAFSADGAMLAVGGVGGPIDLASLGEANRNGDYTKALDLRPGRMAGSLALWDGQGRFKEVRHPHPLGVSSVAFAPDGQLLASGGSNGRITFWDLTADKVRSTMSGHNGATTSLAFGPDSSTLVSGGDDGAVRIWDLGRSRERSLLFGHTKTVSCVAFPPDGQSVVSGSSDHAVMLWDTVPRPDPLVLTPALEPLPQIVTSAPSLVFAPAPTTLIAAQYNQVHFWDVATGKMVASLSGYGESFPGNNISHPTVVHPDKSVIHNLTMSPDGTLLAANGDSGITVWDVAASKEVAQLSTPRPPGDTTTNSVLLPMHFSPDGTTLIVGNTRWSTSDWTENGDKLVETGTSPRAFSPNGRYSVSILDNTADGSSALILRDMATESIVQEFNGHHGAIEAVVFSPDSQLVAGAGRDGIVRLWSIVTGQEQSEFKGHTKGVLAVAFSPDGRTVASAGLDATVRLWDPLTGQERLTFRYQGRIPHQVAFSADSRNLAVSWQSDPGKRFGPGVVTVYRGME